MKSRTLIITISSFVLFIPSILLILMLPNTHRASDSALSSMCQSNLHKINYALKLYANDYDDWFPPEKNGLELLVKLGYLDKKYLKCPLYNMEGGMYFYKIKNRRKGSDYVYIPGHKNGPEVVAICYDKPQNHFGKDTKNTTNVLFTNSQVIACDECNWKEEVAKYEKKCNPSYLTPRPNTEIRNKLLHLKRGTRLSDIEKYLNLNSPVEFAYPSKSYPVYTVIYKIDNITIRMAAERISGDIKNTKSQDFIFKGDLIYSEYIGPKIQY